MFVYTPLKECGPCDLDLNVSQNMYSEPSSRNHPTWMLRPGESRASDRPFNFPAYLLPKELTHKAGANMVNVMCNDAGELSLCSFLCENL